MADIAMCDNKSCVKKQDCYRYTSPKNPHRQAYGYFEPFQYIMPNGTVMHKCINYISNKEGKKWTKNPSPARQILANTYLKNYLI